MDGGWPTAGLAIDEAGSLYGTTLGGGEQSCESGGCGVVFELTRTAVGWKETVLHTFQGTDGTGAYTGVTLVPASIDGGPTKRSPAIFGTTLYGGDGYSGALTGGGVVFQLVNYRGRWTYRTLYEFSSHAGRPGGPPIIDKSGILYDMNSLGGIGNGAVFELRPTGLTETGWEEADIYSFRGPPADGWFGLYQGVVMDRGGNLYGTTSSGGSSQNCFGGCGTVFRLSKTQGKWAESDLYSLTGGAAGSGPLSGVILGRDGLVYGMTPFGGDASCSGDGQPGCGVVFRISP